MQMSTPILSVLGVGPEIAVGVRERRHCVELVIRTDHLSTVVEVSGHHGQRFVRRRNDAWPMAELVGRNINA
jgi:hypothetical protein